MLQPQAAILECVSAAGSEAEIQDGLSRLAQVMDWDLLTTLLDLQDRWPSTPSLVGTPSTSWLACPWTLTLHFALMRLQPTWTPNMVLTRGFWSVKTRQALCFIHMTTPSIDALALVQQLHFVQQLCDGEVYVDSLSFRPPPKDPGTYTQRKLGTCLDFLLGFSIIPISAKWFGCSALCWPMHIEHFGCLQSRPQSTGLKHTAPCSTTWVNHAPSTVFTLDLVDTDHPFRLHAWLWPLCSSCFKHIAFTLGGMKLPVLPLQINDLDWTTCWRPASAPLDLQTHSSSAHRPEPPSSILVSLTHEGSFNEGTSSSNFFENDIHFVIYLVNDDGKLSDADHRVWTPLTPLAPQLWPPGFKAAGQLHVSLDFTHLSFGYSSIGCFIDFCPQRSWSCTQILLINSWIKPRCSLHILSQATSPSQPCHLPLCGHWALLWGQMSVNNMHWTYSDGRPSITWPSARHHRPQSPAWPGPSPYGICVGRTSGHKGSHIPELWTFLQPICGMRGNFGSVGWWCFCCDVS